MTPTTIRYPTEPDPATTGTPMPVTTPGPAAYPIRTRRP